MSPVGVGAPTMSNIPASPYVPDPALFFQLTSKNILTPRSVAIPGPGLVASTIQLPQAGIIAKLQIIFSGTLVVATADATCGDRWPYGFLSDFVLSANGQNNLFNCDGLDLHALRFARYPAYVERVDVFPSVVGGGTVAAVGTHTMHLTWEVPIAMDDVSLIGALFAQSSATNLSVRLSQALNTDLFSANPANATLAGTFHIQVESYTIPTDSEGRIVTPDLSRLHGFNAIDLPLTAVGETRAPLIRGAGQLGRLFVSVRRTAAARLSGLPNTAATAKWEALRLEYGANQRPYTFDPLSQLLAKNGQHYGAPLPYDRAVLDFLKENPIRDVILLQGVTELVAIPRVGTGVTVSGGSIRLVQETLF